MNLTILPENEGTEMFKAST
jgi:myosin heavy subunit